VRTCFLDDICHLHVPHPTNDQVISLDSWFGFTMARPWSPSRSTLQSIVVCNLWTEDPETWLIKTSHEYKVGCCKFKTEATEAALQNFNHKTIAQIVGIVGYQAFSTIVQDARQLEKGCCRPFHQSIHCLLPTKPVIHKPSPSVLFKLQTASCDLVTRNWNTLHPHRVTNCLVWK
jgi:hypothetical protein